MANIQFKLYYLTRCLILFLLLSLAGAPGASPKGGKRIAVLLNITHRKSARKDAANSLPSFTEILEAGFDQLIVMDGSQKNDLIPIRKNVKTLLKSLAESPPDFLFVYYLGYGMKNRLALGKRFLSRNVLLSWINEASKTSFTVFDIISPPLSGPFDKTVPISSIEDISPDESHYLLQNRQINFLPAFTKSIASHPTGLTIASLYKKLDKSPLIEIKPKAGNEMVLLAGKTTPAADTEPIITKREESSISPKEEPLQATAQPRKIPAPPPRKVVISTEPDYFKPITEKAGVNLLETREAESPDKKIITPVVSQHILFGLRAADGAAQWKLALNKRFSEYGINYVDRKYLFAVFQDEFDGTAILKVIDRATGREKGWLPIWGNLTFYQPYQSRFITIKHSKEYHSYIAIRTRDRRSEIVKITYDPRNNKLFSKNYRLDYLISSPLKYHRNKLYWGGKSKNRIIIGSLDPGTEEKKEYTLPPPSKEIKFNEYTLENPPLVIAKGYGKYRQEYFFVSLNRKALAPKGKTENLIVVYQESKSEKNRLAVSSSFDFQGRIISSPALFQDPNVRDLYYVYFFSAITPREPDKQGIRNLLTIFEPFFWIKGMYLGSNNYPLESLSQGNLLGIPYIFKREQEYLLLMASNDVYLYHYNQNKMGRREWAKEYRYNQAVDKGVNLGSRFHGISTSTISRAGNNYLIKTIHRDRPIVYAYTLEKLTGPVDKELFEDPLLVDRLLKKRVIRNDEKDPGYAFFDDRFTNTNQLLMYLDEIGVDNHLAVLNAWRSSFKHGKEGKKIQYRPQLSWVFEGGDPISAPIAYHENRGELLLLSKEKLLGIPLKTSQTDNKSWKSSFPGYKLGAAYQEVFAQPYEYENRWYWVALSTMYTADETGPPDQPIKPVKFADLSDNITTGVSFNKNIFAYGTKNNGVEVFTFNKENYYSFFNPEAAVTCAPLIHEDMIYFATQKEQENYVYGLKLDSENLFMLPAAGWGGDDSFVSPDSWRVKIKHGGIITKPVAGLLGGQPVIFIGTTEGMIYSYPLKQDDKGAVRPLWSFRLPQIDEGVYQTMVFDQANRVLYCLTNKGKLYLLKPGNKTPVMTVFSIKERDVYRDFRPTEMRLTGGNLCFSVTSTRQTSVFYCLNYGEGKYLRVALSKEAVFKPLLINNQAYVSCRSGEIFQIGLPNSLSRWKINGILAIRNR